MFNHEPKGYDCPFCPLINGKDYGYNQQKDIIYKNKYTTAFIAPKWWVNNPGSVIVISNKHYENIYDIPDQVIGEIYKTVKKIAIAIKKTYKSDGISTRQHNEPEGNQDVWHFHAHVFPRYTGDNLYQNHSQKRWVTSEEKAIYANKLKSYFMKIKGF